MAYLTPDHPDAFYRMRLKMPPDHLPVVDFCPKCKGYGGLRLELNAHGPGRHFNCLCSQCNGYGWVTEEDLRCIHEWKEIPSTHRFQHEYRCTKCPRTSTTYSDG